jgi:HAD superfamily hydrolase (TIGR01484 family)
MKISRRQSAWQRRLVICGALRYLLMMPIRLLSTDFDGTLIGHSPDLRAATSLAQALTDLRKGGVLWAVNTGRQLWFALEGLEKASLPHDPDYVLTSERDIFHRAGEGDWEAFGDWNARSEGLTIDLFGRARHLFDAIEEMVVREDGIELLYENNRPAGIMTVDVPTMDRAVSLLRRLASDVPEFSFNRNEVWLRFAHREIHKGSALAELARLLSISRDDVLAIGDHYNDIPMLDGAAAAMVACPANAVDEVKDVVREAGGYISAYPWSEGVADAIRHFSS